MRCNHEQVYKGFDEKQGIDVAWSKVLKEHNQLTDGQMAAIVQEMKVGLDQVWSSSTWNSSLETCITVTLHEHWHRACIMAA